MALDPVTGMLIGGGINALTGIFGANSAADAQKQAAAQQGDTARRNMFAQLMLAEPSRGVGYQALQGMASLYGYSTPAYRSVNDIHGAMSPVSSRAIKNAYQSGMTVDQLAQMGTLGELTAKGMKRLRRAGLSPEDILRLQGRGPQNAAVPGAATGAAPNSAQSIFDRISQLPGYQFGMQEGTGAVERSAAARGGVLSGNNLRNVNMFGQNYAGTKLNEDWNRMGQLAGFGSAGTGAASNAVGGAAGALMGAQQQAGDARASGVLGTTNSIGNAVNSGMNNYLLWQMINRPQPPVGGSYGRGI